MTFRVKNAAMNAGPSARADRTGRWLSAANVLFAFAALASGVLQMLDASDDDLIVETWRTFGFVVFAGLWAMVALWPRRTPGVWELLISHKAAMTIFAIFVIEVPTARVTALVDGFVVITTAGAYVLCRGWLARTIDEPD